ncbi:DoxX family protein [Candidatus Protochlamydia amoebophila]|uniref:DoxX family protein n=1 Tax=Protochlamydia amoebophila (strain UWE25) TaxID=264201 RepID=Q6MCR7_PARUW|nr:DoxX family protein [Candidatus Protochlamydia amoebophila]CAF23632.1 unnamed protein product [Candidatus Protochlamydia amoebophila UWE25]
MFKERAKAYQKLITFATNLKSPILMLCRLYWGTLFLLAGWGKLTHMDPFISLLTQFDFPAPYFFAYLAACTEFFGGICLILGLASRVAAIPLIITMLIAYATAHQESLKSIFRNPTEFVAESPFNFLLISLFVFAFGPGRFSIDYLIEKYLLENK